MIEAPGDTLSLVLFSINGMILTTLSAGLRRAYERATNARETAERSANRSERLQLFALALNRPMSPKVLAQTAIANAVDLLGASGGLVAIGRADDPELSVLATHGYTGGVVADARVPNNLESPLGTVMQSVEPTFLRSRAERQARYPAVADQFAIDGDSMVLPLLYEGDATGAIYLNFEGRSGYGPDDRDYLRSIGVQCGSALARAILIERADAMVTTEQARAGELETVLEAIGDGLLVGNVDGRIILANPAVERLLGSVPAHLSDLPDRAEDALGEPGNETRFLARSPVQAKGWLEIARFPVVAKGRSSDVVLIRDVTAAVEADLQRDAFLGVLSHELRTPITTIMGGVALLQRLELTLDERSRGLLDDIDAESTRLHRIVEDLLVLTRSERGALDIRGEPVLLHRVVQTVIDRERIISPGVDIRLVSGGRTGAGRGGADVRPADRPELPVQRAEVRPLGQQADRGRGQPDRRHDRDARARPGRRVQSRRHRAPVHALLPQPQGDRERAGRGHRLVRLPPARRGDGRDHVGPVATGRRRRVRVRAAADARRGHLPGDPKGEHWSGRDRERSRL